MELTAASPAQRRTRGLFRCLGFWLLVLVLPLAAGCQSGFDAQSQQVYQPADGVNDRSSDVYVINALVVTDGKGNGTVVVALVNQADEDDQLVSLTAEGASGEPLEAAPVPADFMLASGQSVQTAESSTLRVSGKEVEAGALVTLTFEFKLAEPVTVDVPVLPQGTDYRDVEVGPLGGGAG